MPVRVTGVVASARSASSASCDASARVATPLNAPDVAVFSATSRLPLDPAAKSRLPVAVKPVPLMLPTAPVKASVSAPVAVLATARICAALSPKWTTPKFSVVAESCATAGANTSPLRSMVSPRRAVLARPSMLPEEVSDRAAVDPLKSPDVAVLRSMLAVAVAPETTVPPAPLTAVKPAALARL